MGWKDWFSGERNDGESEKTSDVDIKIKTNDKDEVTDILVSESGNKSTHDHYYDVNKGQSGGVERVDWSSDKSDK